MSSLTAAMASSSPIEGEATDEALWPGLPPGRRPTPALDDEAGLTTRCQDHRMVTGRDNARLRNYNPRIAMNIARLPELLGIGEPD
jgi:hypothetical protein